MPPGAEMSRVVVPNLATDWKARVGVAAVGIAIGLIVTLVTRNLGVSGMVMGSYALLINLVRYRQERALRLQASSGHPSDSN
jgi:hypothetical protein